MKFIATVKRLFDERIARKMRIARARAEGRDPAISDILTADNMRKLAKKQHKERQQKERG